MGKCPVLGCGRGLARTIFLGVIDSIRTMIETIPANPLPIDQIFPSKFQPRSYFSPEGMKQLVSSVKQYGILEAIIVRPIATNRYELVAGERRYKAAKAVGFTQVPAIIKEMCDAEALQCALMENLQREDLNPVEETEGILRLLELKLEIDRPSVISRLNQIANHDRGLTNNVIRKEDEAVIASVFQSIGRLTPESFRTNRLPVLNLPPEILEAIRRGDIKYTKGKAIAKVKDPQLRAEILQDAIAHSLSLSEIKKRVKGQYPATERDELQTRLEALPKKIKTLKVWDHPDKRSKLKALVDDMERLLAE